MDRPPLNPKLFIVLFAGFLALIGLILFLLGQIIYMIGVACWKHPPLLAVMAFCVLGFMYTIRRIHRIEREEISRFEQRAGVKDAEFLADMKIDPTSPEARVALVARQVFADLGSVPAECIRAADRFYPDMEKLPFYDSIDSLQIILELEKTLQIKIYKDLEDRIQGKVMANPSATVGEAVGEVLHAWREQHQKGVGR